METASEQIPQKHICLGLLAHVDAGKTTLSEGLLYTGGTIRKIGRVDKQDAYLDMFAYERERGITIFSKQAVLTCGDVKITLLDTPGHVDFSAETERVLQVLDYAVLVISGADGVQGHTETLWRLLKDYRIPVFVFVNKMDQPGTERGKILQELQQRLSDAVIPYEDTARFREEAAMCKEEALEELQETGIAAKESQLSPYGVVAEKGYLAGSELFINGCLTIQDESSMLVAPSMQIEPHHRVLDACAAPGGKTTHIATFLEAEAGGRVTSLDIHAHKIKLINENAQRLHVADVVQAEKLDARQVAEEFPAETFDRILVDAPCSGLGLMRRKPDIKYHKTANDFQNLPKIQLEILESVAPTLKQWGIMVYSTCTITPEENQEVVAAFLAKHPEFEKIEIVANENVQAVVKEQELVLYPHQYMTDGFFICCMRKVSSNEVK